MDLHAVCTKHFATYLHDTNAIVRVGVSGGVDSMTLWHLLSSWRHTEHRAHNMLRILHYDHNQRDDTAKDIACIHTQAGEHSVHTGTYTGTGHHEHTLRNARYRFFFATMQQYNPHGTHILVLGHHADDRIETSLLHMMRGCERRGICNMQHWREGMPSISLPTSVSNHHAPHTQPNQKNHHTFHMYTYRPLLDIPKHAIRSYAHTQNIKWNEDTTNTNPHISQRNAIRNILTPLLQQNSHGNAWYRSWNSLYTLLESCDGHSKHSTNSIHKESTECTVGTGHGSMKHGGLLQCTIPLLYQQDVSARYISPRPSSRTQLHTILNTLGCNIHLRHTRRQDLWKFCTDRTSGGYTLLQHNQSRTQSHNVHSDIETSAGYHRHCIRSYNTLLWVYGSPAWRGNFINNTSYRIPHIYTSYNSIEHFNSHAHYHTSIQHHTPGNISHTTHYFQGLHISLPTILPPGSIMRFPHQGDRIGSKTYGRRCNNKKIPLCLRPIIPIVVHNNTIIYVCYTTQALGGYDISLGES